MKYTLISFVCCFLILQSIAQKKQELFAKDKLIRVNFTSLIDPFETNFSVGYEKRFKDNFAYSIDMGYVFFNSFYQGRLEKTGGVILRPAIRYYSGESKRFYVEAEMHYKNVTNKVLDWIGRECVNNVSAYEEYTTFKIRKKVIGFNLKVGYQARLSNDNRFWLEPYVGLGIKYKNTFLVNEPNSCFAFNNFLSRGRQRVSSLKESVPNIPFGIRFLVKL